MLYTIIIMFISIDNIFGAVLISLYASARCIKRFSPNFLIWNKEEKLL